ncbi:hypothetical protein [Bacillus sp. FJAT-27445]|uniref:hypothetical protein n=1 Tax=Bacillus sp. FJAT-27445 TaxID=1679166 RepID=UPI000743DCA1|nr:hypothetical protein [Bacillus sp. FJAT-27445]
MVSFYSAIVKFVVALGFCLSKPQFHHLISIMHGIILAEGRKTVTQIREHTAKDRDTFLKESPLVCEPGPKKKVGTSYACYPPCPKKSG